MGTDVDTELGQRVGALVTFVRVQRGHLNGWQSGYRSNVAAPKDTEIDDSHVAPNKERHSRSIGRRK